MKKLLLSIALLLGITGAAKAGGYGGGAAAISSSTAISPSTAAVANQLTVGNGATIATFTATTQNFPSAMQVTNNGSESVAFSSVTTQQVIGSGANTSTFTATVIDLSANTQLKTYGARVGLQFSVNAAGTAYSITTTTAAVTFGTTSPSITITSSGTYIVFGSVNVKYNASTFAANRVVRIAFRRTNNTAGYLGTDRTGTTRIITSITDDMGIFPLSPLVYTTINTNDAIAIFAGIDTGPTAGSIDIFEAEIYAIRLY